MKIEEAIEHTRYVAKKIREEEGLCVDDLNAHNCKDCLECAKEYEQMAEWLEELQYYRSELAKKLDEKVMHGLTGGGEQIRNCCGDVVYCNKDCPRCLVRPVLTFK